MHYKSPKFENKEQWVPVVAKNKDWLVGYISGIQMLESLISNSLEENGMAMDLRGLDLCLDSSRFNDVMEDGKKESDCTINEIRKYYDQIIDKKLDMIKEHHPENGDVLKDYFFEVECSCGLGIFLFKTPKEIPDKPFKCNVCGRTVIDYTNHNDEEYEYEGNTTQRVNLITEELAKKITKNNENQDNE